MVVIPDNIAQGNTTAHSLDIAPLPLRSKDTL